MNNYRLTLRSNSVRLISALHKSQNGHSRPAEQQSSREVSAAGCGNAAGYTWHVPDWHGVVSPKAVAQPDVLTGKRC